MRKLFLVAVAVALLAVAAGFLWPERGRTKPVARCPETGSLAFHAPAAIAWGRTGVIRAEQGYGDEIISEFEVSIDGAAYAPVPETATGDGKIGVTMAQGRASMRFAFRWKAETFASDPVTKTCEITIKGGRGRLGPMEFHERLGGIAVFEFVDLLSWECAAAALVPATVTVSSGTERRQLTVADQCLPNQVRRSTQARNWRLSTDPDGIAFRALGRRPARQTFSFAVRIGPTLTRGRFVVTRRFWPGGRIWQGTDNFVNICINRGYPIYSSGGRLYCVQASLLTYRVERTK